MNGTIIDVEDGKSFVGSILIVKDKIIKIYRQTENLPEDVYRVDATGKFLIPGLIDMHCHINVGYAPYFVASGVTTVRNTAGNVIALKELIDNPADVPTPRVYSADRMIDGTPGQWGPTSYGNLVTDDPEIARKEVRRQLSVGVKFIKLYGWVNSDVMAAVVDEASKYHLEVAIDLLNSHDMTALDAAKMGVTWFEHASGFAQEIYPGWNPLADQEEWKHIDWEEPDKEKIRNLCQKMLRYKVKLCPTLVLTDQAIRFPTIWTPDNLVMRSMKNNSELMKQWDSLSEHIESIKKQNTIIHAFTKEVAKTYSQLGGTVVAGTDTPALLYTFPGMALHRELEIFVEIGFSELAALQAATIHAANAINLSDIGSIKEGKTADIVILEKDPLENISNTQEILYVIKGGKVNKQQDILDHIPSKEVSKKAMEDFLIEWESLYMS
ncbi:amidohydrolase family protein [Alkalibacterium sp. f15]|uniref:amidohydrolase family protein n=1 Tax=Alkalibacterium sp. f15 TaxID=3414029 RepID=UPI003BF8A46D